MQSTGTDLLLLLLQQLGHGVHGSMTEGYMT
jgi:hypothetical protein